MRETKYPQLSRPPLREALVDIKLRETLPVSWMGKVENANFDGFANSQPMRQGSFRIEMPQDKPASAVVDSEQPFGRRFNSKDESQVLQIRRNGMTLSILKNYTNWEALRYSAHVSWDSYLEISGPIDVNRLALRYINAIEMKTGGDYDNYLTAGPRIPHQLPQIANSFVQRVEIPFTNYEATAIVTQTLEVAGNVSAILDIDVFCPCLLNGISEEIWLRLDNLRDIANDIFFSSITPDVLKSYL